METVFKKLRENAGLSPSELIEEFKVKCNFDINQSAISKLEGGSTQYPKKDTLSAYKTYFNVSIDYLLGFTNIQSTNPNMEYISNITGLSEKSLLVLDYLRRFNGKKNSATAMLNYSTITCLNKILETYYDQAMQSKKDQYSIGFSCPVETLFSRLNDYFEIENITASISSNKIVKDWESKRQKGNDRNDKLSELLSNIDKITISKDNYSKDVDLKKYWSQIVKDDVIREIDNIKYGKTKEIESYELQTFKTGNDYLETWNKL